jgi:uncharacterized membrane protein YkvA (DUF1232 family)
MDLPLPVIYLAVVLAAYLLAVGGVMALGRRVDVRFLLGSLVAFVRLLRRLIADRRVPRRHKLLLGFAIAYLLVPFDLVPDFIPVVGYADDVLLAALGVRLVLRRAGPDVVTEHWAGPPDLLPVILRLAEISLRPPIGVVGGAMVAGALGLGVCVWFDIADNCATCAERDPALLSAGRDVAVTLCALATMGLAARALVRPGPSPPAPRRANRRG